MKSTILIVSELESQRADLLETLQAGLSDARLEVAEGVQAGLDQAKALFPDIMVLDLPLQTMAKEDLCEQFARFTRTASTQVLILLAEGQKESSLSESCGALADAVLSKPVAPDALMAEVKVLLRIRRSALRHTRALKDSEAGFRSLFDCSPDALFVLGAKGDILDANPAASVFCKTPIDDLIGMNSAGFLASDGAWPDAFDLIAAPNEALTHLRSRQHDPEEPNRQMDVLARTITFHHEPAVLLQIRDVGRNRKIEQALRGMAEDISEASGFSFFYRLVQKLCATLNVDYVFIATTNKQEPGRVDTIAFCHRGEIIDNMSYDLAQTPCEKVVGRLPCFYAEGVQQTFPEDRQLVEFGIEAYMGIPLFGSESEPLGLLVLMHTRRLGDSELARSLLQIYAHRGAAEIERMHAAEELWESEERYRSLTDDVLESSAVGIFILNKQFEVVWVNLAAQTYIGLERDELLGQDYRELVKTRLETIFDQPEGLAERVLASYENEDFLENVECKTRSGERRKERWLEHWSQPIRSGLYKGGRIEYFSDITTQKRLQVQLLQSQKMESIGRLAGGIAHDFNNLLTSILGFSFLIKDDLPEDHPVQSSVDEVIQAGQRAENLTRQLLVFSRKQNAHLQAVNINYVVEDMDRLLRRTLGDNIRLDLHLQHAGLEPIFADASQLEQVIMNLCINARDAMPKGGVIVIKTAQSYFDADACRKYLGAQPGDYVMLSTSDNGCGMSKEIREHACEPFFSTKEKGKGTGLGLAIVYGIVQQFKGFMDIQSEPEMGTDVHIYLPVSREPLRVPERPASEYIPRGTETVLVVEDEESVRMLTVKILQSLGYQVLSASHGEEGIAVFEKEGDAIHLVLTDVIMPQMNGPEMIQRLQQVKPGLKFIFTSGFTEDAIQKHGLDESRHKLIPKPYTRKTLAQNVRAELDEA